MTEVVTRPALQTLSMAASQHKMHRRSATNAFDEEIHNSSTASKRPRLDNENEPLPESLGGRKIGTSRSKKAYHEVVDGFSFSKGSRRPTKGAAKPLEGNPTKPLRRSPPARQPQGPEPDGAPTNALTAKTATAPKRRSGRLSAMTSTIKATEDPASHRPSTDPTPALEDTGARLQPQENSALDETRHGSRGRKRRASPDPNGSTAEPGRQPESPDAPIEVVKSRKPTKIALPFHDTPVIERNKKMRKTSGQGRRRRSSSIMRGRRASFLMDNGTSAVPHGEVQVPDFFKHIAQDIPETRRMKQLITWCGSRAISDKPPDPSDDVNAVLAARVIQDELVKDFTTQADLSDWYHRDEAPPEVLVKKPNPRNVQNAAKLVELEAEVQRLQAEAQLWASLTNDFDKQMSKSLEARELDGKSHADSEVSNRAAALLNATSAAKPDRVETSLRDFTHSLERDIDGLAEGVNILAQLGKVMDACSMTIERHAGENLQNASEDGERRNDTAKAGMGDVLRAFSRAGR